MPLGVQWILLNTLFWYTSPLRSDVHQRTGSSLAPTGGLLQWMVNVQLPLLHKQVRV